MKIKNQKANSLRYVFSVQSDDGYYVDGFNSSEAAFRHCDHMRRRASCKAVDRKYFVMRETFRENRLVYSAPEITIRVVLDDGKEILENTYFCSRRQAINAMLRIISGAGRMGCVKHIGFVERRISHV